MVLTAREAIIQLGLMFEAGEHLSLKTIKKKFNNISSRTAHRYIATLRSEYSAPIEYSDIENTYYCSTPWSIIESLKR